MSLEKKAIQSKIKKALEFWEFDNVRTLYDTHMELGFHADAFLFYYESAQLEKAFELLQKYDAKYFDKLDYETLKRDLRNFLDGEECKFDEHIKIAYDFMQRLSKNSLEREDACNLIALFLPKSSLIGKAFFIKAVVDYFTLNDPSFFTYGAYHVLMSLHNDFDGTLMGRLYMDKFEYAFKNNVFKEQHLKHGKRVALTISGALRGKNWLSLLNKLIDDVGFDADVFFFTWDRQYHWMGLGGSPWWVHRLFPSLERLAPNTIHNTGVLYRNFPHTYAKLMHANSTHLSLVKVKQIKNLVAFCVENEDDFLERFQLPAPSNCQKMWYGKYRLLQMLEEHESKEGFKYDFIINVRPDGIIEKSCDFERLERMAPMDVSVILGGEGVNDACLVGRPEAMKLFLGIWDRALKNKHLDLFASAPQIMGTHYMPHYLFMLEGVRIVKPFLNLDIINALKPEDMVLPNFEKALEKDIELTPLRGEELKKSLEFFERFKGLFGSSSEGFLLGAPARVANHLAYKLGLAMIRNSKTFWGYVKLPYILMSIKIAHQEEQKIIQEKIKYGYKTKLPPLELYDDYEEAMKIQSFLSYKMGEALMRGYKNLWGGVI